MGELSRWRAALRVLATLTAEIALLALLWGTSSVFGSVELAHLGGWMRKTSPTGALTALLRLLGMGVAAWLLASTLLYLAASLTGSDGLVRRTGWATLPRVRRMVDGLTAASILASVMLASNGSSGQPLAAAVVQPVQPHHPDRDARPRLPTLSRRPPARSSVSDVAVGRHLPHPGVLDHPELASYSSGALPVPMESFDGLVPGTKFVVVRRGDCLSVLAQDHLGDWRLDIEIFELNVGRIQPDGRALVDDHWIYPGWILVMPENAVGAEVVPRPETAPPVVPSGPGQVSRPPVTGPAETVPPVPTTEPAAAPSRVNPNSGPTGGAGEDSSTTLNGTRVPHGATNSRPTSNDAWIPDLVAPSAGIAALAAAGLLWRLGRRRREQLHRRRTGEELRPNPPPVVAVETTARAIADTEAMRWVDAGLRFLGGQFAERHQSASPGYRSPQCPADARAEVQATSVVLVRAGGRGLEVMVAPACEDAPPHWTAIDEGAVWILDPALELEELEKLAGDRWPFLPALVTVGTTVDGAVLANLEHAGSLAVEGEPGRVRAMLGQLLIELTSQPWTEEMLRSLDVIGNWESPGLPGVEHQDDPLTLVQMIERSSERTIEQLCGFESAAARRAVEGESLPRVVVAFPGTEQEIVRRLAEAAEPDRSSVVLVASGADSEARWRLTLDGGRHAVLSGLAGYRSFRLSMMLKPEEETIDLLSEAIRSAATAPASPLPSVAEPATDTGEPDSPADEEDNLPSHLEEVGAEGEVDLRLLGTLRVAGATGRIESARRDAPLAVLAYLATRQHPVSLHDLAAALWPADSTKEHFGIPAPKTVHNVISRARTLVGTTEHGEHRLMLVDGGYVLASSVTSDWGRFRSLTGRARSRPASEKAELLRRALELIEGPPFNGSLDSQFFEWVSAEQLPQVIAAAVVDTAEELARLSLDAGDHDAVLCAVEVGLRMDPAREQLYQCWMHALGRRSDVGDVADVWRRLCNALQQHIDPTQCPSPDSHAVYRSYVRSGESMARSR